MIEFEISGKKGTIDGDFNLEFSNEETSKLLRRDIELFLNNFKPQNGDPFLCYAQRLKKFGVRVLKAEEMKNAEGMIF